MNASGIVFRGTTCLLFVVLTGGGGVLANHGGLPPDVDLDLELVGHHDLGGAGWNTDVWAHGNYAYVGTWGVFGFDCLDGAVKVIDLKDPANLEQVASILAPANTLSNDVKVARVNSRYFHGDVLAISNEACADGGARGVEFWDVSDPVNPTRLSRYGPEVSSDDPEVLVDAGFGVHNTFFFTEKGRTYLGVVIDFAEAFQLLFGVPPAERVGDVRILDITDPRNPVQVGDWGTFKNLGQDPFTGQGSFPFRLAHDIWVENSVAYISYWDAGLIMLDVSDPTDPVLISQTLYADTEEGNAHVAVPARGGRLVLVGDEDLTAGPWGFLRIFDTRDASAPVEIATFATENTRTDPPTEAGEFSIHNLVVRGNRAYISWYSDGVRVIDFSKPSAPVEIGRFVPPALPDPNGFFETAPNIWGIYVHGDLILASDINGGLYVLK